METPQPDDLFTRSWTLLCANLPIMVPGIFAGLVGGAAQAFFAPSTVSGGSFGWGIASLIGLFASVAALTYETKMAQVAWERGVVRIDDGKAAFAEDSRRVGLAVILLSLAGMLATIFSFFTLGLSLLAFSYLSVYTIASVVVGRHTPVEAFVESARIASKRIPQTVRILLSFIGLFVSAGIIGFILRIIPLLGPIVASVLLQACSSYFVIVIVGEYLTACGNPPRLQIPEMRS